METEIPITYWDELDQNPCRTTNYWISEAMRSAVGVHLYNNYYSENSGYGEVPNLSIEVDRVNGKVIIREGI